VSLVGHRVERHGDGQDQHVVLAWLDLHAVVVRHPEPLLRDLGDFVPPPRRWCRCSFAATKAYEHAFNEGDPQNHIFRVKQGMLRLYRLLADGRRQVISFRFPGHVVGLCDQDTQFYSAEAVTSTVLQCLPLSVVRRRVDEEVKFGSELIRCLAVELAETQNQVAFLNHRSAVEKLATFILRFWPGKPLRSRSSPMHGSRALCEPRRRSEETTRFCRGACAS